MSRVEKRSFSKGDFWSPFGFYLPWINLSYVSRFMMRSIFNNISTGIRVELLIFKRVIPRWESVKTEEQITVFNSVGFLSKSLTQVTLAFSRIDNMVFIFLLVVWF